MSTLGPTQRKYLGEVKDPSYLNSKNMTCISLFTGAGGAALGIRKAGFDVRVMVEWEKAACNTLRCNWIERPENWREILAEQTKEYTRKLKRAKSEKRKWFIETYETPTFWWQERPPAILEGDITKITTEEILKAADLRVGEATMLEGGFPCQGFSTANSRRDGEDYSKDERNFLYLEAVRVIREALPRTFFLENVPGLVSMEKGRVIRMICKDLAESGYNVSWDIHNAADYGVPQNRRRVLILGSRNDVMIFPESGKPQLHIGGAVGTIHHPAWFDKKYPIESKDGRGAGTRSRRGAKGETKDVAL